ncbi:hypothetical protein GTY65_24305 [Streptomyces sp. SID8379]|uniref:hypothetical protein n=1 Tax=unclassified Streptomyces TaxID=2593676 RepID=UPI0003754A17|nr:MULTISPECIES: hypothetical protein [unclassified Streptomyces]MYW67166.1 hypothetical protein [Streptomyces sp. SID8379]
MTWLDDFLAEDRSDVRDVQRVARVVLDRLSKDRGLLTKLVDAIPDDPARIAASRVTVLLNRLSLYEAHGFEIRLNLNPREDNQLVPHDHCYTFATRILRGGYVHVVRRRTNGWEGPFGGDDVEPAIVTVERPGSTYTLGHSMVHQAVMKPDTVTLFMRGPRCKETSHAVEELMPPVSSWPTAEGPGAGPVDSRSATLDEYHAMRTYLSERSLID